MLHRVQVTDTSQHQLFRGDCVSQAFMVKLLQRNHYQTTPIIRRDLLGPRNTSNFGSNRYVFVRRRVGDWMISTCVVPTMKHGGGGVMVWGCLI